MTMTLMNLPPKCHGKIMINLLQTVKCSVRKGNSSVGNEIKILQKY